mmetsp:Transcript_19157/g.51577  ORF Transcript_19157/g.51577 Transcript_19157/m.51577 type:complete len:257 (+) Transcript_19157:961-1731(+)
MQTKTRGQPGALARARTGAASSCSWTAQGRSARRTRRITPPTAARRARRSTPHSTPSRSASAPSPPPSRSARPLRLPGRRPLGAHTSRTGPRPLLGCWRRASRTLGGSWASWPPCPPGARTRSTRCTRCIRSRPCAAWTCLLRKCARKWRPLRRSCHPPRLRPRSGIMMHSWRGWPTSGAGASARRPRPCRATCAARTFAASRPTTSRRSCAAGTRSWAGGSTQTSTRRWRQPRASSSSTSSRCATRAAQPRAGEP